jgi:hypothetical protein
VSRHAGSKLGKTLKPTSCVDVSSLSPSSAEIHASPRVRQSAAPVHSWAAHRHPGKKPLVQSDGPVVDQLPDEPVVLG